MTALRTALSIIGVLPILLAVYFWVQQYRRAQRVLSFRRSMPVDIVLTTSSVALSEHGKPVSRPLTGYGQVRGVANCAQALAKHYPRKAIQIHLSGFIRNRLDHDLVVLGGPAKNEVSRTLLKDIAVQYNLKKLEFNDIDGSLNIVDSYNRELRIDNFDTELREGAPASDIGLIIAISRRDHPSARRTRCIFCAGFTTYGTAAAAEYMFLDLPSFGLRRLNDLLGTGYRSVKSVGDFIIVTEARFSRGECTDIVPRFQTTLVRR